MNKNLIASLLFWIGWSILLFWYISIWEGRMLISLPIMIIILISLPIRFYIEEIKKKFAFGNRYASVSKKEKGGEK